MLSNESLEVDVLIVGSGPVGATFCRVLSEAAPQCRIAMVDVGPSLARRAGIHVRNIVDPDERVEAQVLSQGPTRYRYDSPSLVERTTRDGHMIRTATLARPGTHLVGVPRAGVERSMPAAAASSDVGGMGSHWTCACPRPGDSEKIPYFNEQEFEAIYSKAEALLQVSTSIYPESKLGSAIEQRLAKAFDGSNSRAGRPYTSGLPVFFEWAAPLDQFGDDSRRPCRRDTEELHHPFRDLVSQSPYRW